MAHPASRRGAGSSWTTADTMRLVLDIEVLSALNIVAEIGFAPRLTEGVSTALNGSCQLATGQLHRPRLECMSRSERLCPLRGSGAKRHQEIGGRPDSAVLLPHIPAQPFLAIRTRWCSRHSLYTQPWT
jgi:hypothetical protein